MEEHIESSDSSIVPPPLRAGLLNIDFHLVASYGFTAETLRSYLRQFHLRPIFPFLHVPKEIGRPVLLPLLTPPSFLPACNFQPRTLAHFFFSPPAVSGFHPVCGAKIFIFVAV